MARIRMWVPWTDPEDAYVNACRKDGMTLRAILRGLNARFKTDRSFGALCSHIRELPTLMELRSGPLSNGEIVPKRKRGQQSFEQFIAARRKQNGAPPCPVCALGPKVLKQLKGQGAKTHELLAWLQANYAPQLTEADVVRHIRANHGAKQKA